MVIIFSRTTKLSRNSWRLYPRNDAADIPSDLISFFSRAFPSLFTTNESSCEPSLSLVVLTRSHHSSAGGRDEAVKGAFDDRPFNDPGPVTFFSSSHTKPSTRHSATQHLLVVDEHRNYFTSAPLRETRFSFDQPVRTGSPRLDGLSRNGGSFKVKGAGSRI